MTNRHIAATLFNIATILDLAQDNIYRVRAYRYAARCILSLREEAADIVARGEELPLPGVGVRIRRKLAELIGSGSLNFYQELLEDQPQHVRQLMAIEGVGPKLAERLYGGLGISTPDEVIQAAVHGQLRTLYGVGRRREEQLAEAARAALAPLPEAA
jgi:DNA polymerase (family 10)